MSGILSDNVGRASGLMKAAGGGKILQVVGSTVKTAQSSLTSTSHADSLVAAASLTPASSSNKVYVHYSGNWGRSGAIEIHLIIARQIDGGGYSTIAGSGKSITLADIHMQMMYLDSPSTAGSVVDYKIYYKVSTGTAYHNYTYSIGAGDGGSQIVIMEVDCT